MMETGCVFDRELRLEFPVVSRKFGCWNESDDDSCVRLGKSNPPYENELTQKIKCLVGIEMS